MPSIPSKLHREEHAGTPITAFGRRITPITRETQGNVLGISFRLQRPVRMEVEQNGAIQRIAIPRATARAIAIASVASASMVALGFGVAWLARKQRHALGGNNHE